MTEVAPGSLPAWILAARPATLTAAFAPVAVGTACAWRVGGFRWDAALAALLGAFLIQIATNFANDMFDFEKGADTEERLGPTRTAQAGLLSVRQRCIKPRTVTQEACCGALPDGSFLHLPDPSKSLVVFVEGEVETGHLESESAL